MAIKRKDALYRDDDHEFLGFLVEDETGWQAQTIFGYTISRTESRADAEAILREKGLGFLTGVWQYLDKSDRDWHTCVIQEAYENRVKVIRTNAMGYEDPDDRKHYVVENPSETNLIKSA